MIFTDGVRIVSDKSRKELELFCDRIGFKKEKPHYEISDDKMLERAIKHGAQRVSPREVDEAVSRMKKRMEEMKQAQDKVETHCERLF